MYLEDTIAAPATAPGRGAVAIVRLSGPDAIEILRAIWRPLTVPALKPRRLRLGDIVDPETGARVDRAFAVVMPAPRSLTGEDVVELQCHGGGYLVRRVLGLALARGARMAAPGEFSRRAFLNGRIDLTEAEAAADLVEARSERALAQALAQLDGALRKEVDALRGKLVAIRAQLEAEIDFPDEGLRLPSRAETAAALEALARAVAPLHDSFARGRLMREGARLAIVGKPNAGKSSVMNLLLGADRAIVTPVPGTTRDVIEDALQLGPYSLVLQDTAGMRAGADEVERLGVERALETLERADLVLAVFDASQPAAEEDRRIARLARGMRGVALLNKQDLPQALSAAELRALGVDLPIAPFSALKAQGLEALKRELVRALEALAGGEGAQRAAISRERHRAALARTLDALRAARESARGGMPPEIIALDVALAADAIGEITGAVHREEVLDAVFRAFCIGK